MWKGRGAVSQVCMHTQIWETRRHGTGGIILGQGWLQEFVFDHITELTSPLRYKSPLNNRAILLLFVFCCKLLCPVAYRKSRRKKCFKENACSLSNPDKGALANHFLLRLYCDFLSISLSATPAAKLLYKIRGKGLDHRQRPHHWIPFPKGLTIKNPHMQRCNSLINFVTWTTPLTLSPLRNWSVNVSKELQNVKAGVEVGGSERDTVIIWASVLNF